MNKNIGISHLSIYRDLIVVGSEAGTLRFFDFKFRIICWFEELDLSSIMSVSFSQKENEIIKNKDLNYPDFIISDIKGEIH